MRRTIWKDIEQRLDESAAMRREAKRRKTAEARRKALKKKQAKDSK